MRRLLLCLLVGTLVAGLAHPAAANTTTVHEHRGTVSFVAPIQACEPGGPLYETSLTYNFVEHETVFPDGRVHSHYTETGTFEAVPFGHTGPAATGQYVVSSGGSDNRQAFSGIFTFSLQGKFENGTKISTHYVLHFSGSFVGSGFNFFTKCHNRGLG